MPMPNLSKPLWCSSITWTNWATVSPNYAITAESPVRQPHITTYAKFHSLVVLEITSPHTYKKGL